jgi:3-hydroxyisobutyrate dehydrogenase
VADSPRAAAEGADVVISMVADDVASREVWLGEAGALAGVRAGATLIESSTLSPAWVEELANQARARMCELIDAPVTGSRTQARAGELNFLAGGAAATIDGVRDVLLAMGRDVLRLGPSGSGAIVKLVNNFVCGVQVAAIAEAVALIEASGLSRAEALGVLLNGAPGSPLVKAVAGRMVAEDYDVHFRVDLMAKDLAYASALAARHALPLRTAEGALDCFRAASRSALGDRDIAAVVEPLRTLVSARAEALS